MRKFVGMTLPEETIRRLDDARGDVPRSRAVSRILEQHLDKVQNLRTGSGQ